MERTIEECKRKTWETTEASKTSQDGMSNTAPFQK